MLSWISSDFFARSPMLILPLVALGIFMSVFLAVVLRAFLTDKEHIDELSRLPFEDGEVETHG